MEKTRVAAYCRVSTAKEAQEHSFQMQSTHYLHRIAQNPTMELAGIYGDCGKTGRNIAARPDFFAHAGGL